MREAYIEKNECVENKCLIKMIGVTQMDSVNYEEVRRTGIERELTVRVD